MAVKATQSVTITLERDIASVWRFYQLSSSTTAPSAPTEAQGKTFIATTPKPTSIGNWQTTEPNYSSGATNFMYVTELTAFTDGNVSWSLVSKSSSYEAAKEAYNEATNAKKVATNYVSDLTNGVFVHPEGDNDNGVKVTDKVEIMRGFSGDSVSVAEFGQRVRLGTGEDGYTAIYLDPGSSEIEVNDIYTIITPEGAIATNVILDANNISPETKVRRLYYGSDYQLEGIGDVTSTKKTVTKTIYVSDLSSALINGQNFSLGITTNGYGAAYNSSLKSLSFDFEKGVDETKDRVVSVQSSFEVKVTIDYDGIYTFTVTIEAIKTSPSIQYNLHIAYEAVEFIEYVKSDVLLPIHKHHGDIYLNSNECGGIYVGLDIDAGAGRTSEAVAGADMDLFNAIRWLGWYDDVMFGLIIDRDPDLHGYGLEVGMVLRSWVGTIPEYAYKKVQWESSDETVATVDIDTYSDHQIMITGVSVGTCTITGSFESNGKMYQKTLNITVIAPS